MSDYQDQDTINDGMELSDNVETVPSTSTNPLLIEFAAVRSEIAPLLGRPSAIDQLSQALEKYPDQSRWYLSRGMVNIKLEKCDQAIKDLTTAVELASENDNETVYTAILTRAQARSDLGDLEGACSDAKLALEHAKTLKNSTQQTECRNTSVLYQQKLKKQKELAASGPEVVHHGAGVVIEDITEQHAKISAKKAGIIAAVAIAKGQQQADVGKNFRMQFNEKVKAYEEEARKRNKKAKKKNKRKKKKAEAVLMTASSTSPTEKKEREEYKQLYEVEIFLDPDDASITIERIYFPITYTQKEDEC